MSRPKSEQDAYEQGFAEGVLIGHKQGRIIAYMDVQKVALQMMRDAAPYTDTRAASQLVDFTNGQLIQVQNGTYAVTLEAPDDARGVEDGAEQQ